MSDKPKSWHAHRDEHGHVDSIDYGDKAILHLVPGSERNEQYAEQVAHLIDLWRRHWEAQGRRVT